MARGIYVGKNQLLQMRWEWWEKKEELDVLM